MESNPIGSSNSGTLKPIEIERDCCPVCKKIARIFAMVTSMALLGGVIGASLGVASLGFGVPIAIIIGGGIGAITGFVLAFLFRETSPNLKYRLQTLEQIKNAAKDENIENVDRILESIEKVKKVFSQEEIHFKQVYDNPALHNDITIITVYAKTRKDLKIIWRNFLNHLQGLEVVYPDKETMKLDFSFEIQRLEGKEPKLGHVEKFALTSPKASEILEQIVTLQQECLGNIGTWQREHLERQLTQEGSGLLFIREKRSKDILGFFWYFKNNEGQTVIAGMGRKPGASRLGIGEKLFEEFLLQDKNNHSINEVVLHVRESNHSAITLYEKMGFEANSTLLDYYTSAPAEDALEMVLNRGNENYLTLFKREEEAI